LRKQTILLILAGALTIVGLISGPPIPEVADLVIQGGRIAIVDSQFTLCEAVAVRGGRIVYVGDRLGVERLIGTQTRMIDIRGGLVLPGFVDAHAHMYSLAQELSNLRVTDAASFDEIIRCVGERTRNTPKGEWIVGGRWDQNDWVDRSFPVHTRLSAVSPDHPVYLKRIDGNAALANARALAVAGITRDTPDPVGGVIHRMADGSPSGVLVNRSMDLVENLIPKDSPRIYAEKLERAIGHCLALGLTGWHEAGVTPEEIAVYRRLVDDGKLKMRCYAMLGDERHPEYPGDLDALFRENLLVGYGNHFLTVRSVKLFFDGALGSRGAAFFEPYTDDPKNSGLLRVTPEYIQRVAEAALRTGMQLATHCIGDRGNRLCLDAYKKALSRSPKQDHRFRIEHAQFVADRDVTRFARLGILPSMQPTHATSDMSFVRSALGSEREKDGYAWRRFRNRGSIIPCGSDFPVESPDPLRGIYAAVTRQDVNGHPPEGWHPEERLSIEEAIRGFTVWPAYASFQEQILGSIEPGKLADFTILDRDILALPPVEILKTRILHTIVAGKVVYSQPSI